MSAGLVSFVEAIEDVSGGNVKIPQSEFLASGPLAVVDQGRGLVAGYTTDQTAAVKTREPVIVFGDHTRAVKYVDFPFAMGADGIKVLRVKDGFHAKYVYHYLAAQTIPSAGYSRHFKFLKELAVPKPPIVEQRRIAAILDEADALRAKRRQVLAHLDDLTQSIFRKMFGDPLRDGGDIRRPRLGDLARVVTGGSPSRATSSYFGGDVEWIKSDNLGRLVASRAEESLSLEGARQSRVAPAGSVLVTCIAGSPNSIGKCSMVDREVAFNQQINAVMPSQSLDPIFLLAQLKTAPDLVRRKSTGGMKGLVNKSAFEAIEILCPPIELQREFASAFDLVHSRIKVGEVAASALDDLFASLQFRAFRGGL